VTGWAWLDHCRRDIMKCNELLQVENMTVLNSAIRSVPNVQL